MNTRVRDREAGSASLWILAFAMVVWATTAAVVAVGVAVTARHRAAGAADLAALAGAQAAANLSSLPSSTPAANSACAAAESIAEANGGRLLRCEVNDLSVWVVAAVRLHGLAQLTAFGAAAATATAKAGPG